jgi:hypothetical protein
MLSVDWFPHNLLISQLCFVLAGLLVLLKIVVHAVETQGAVTSRVVFAALLSSLAIISAAWVVAAIQIHKAPKTQSPAMESDPAASILAWAKHGEYVAVPLPDPSTYFNFLVTTPDGKIIQVCKPRNFLGERYMLLIARARPTPPQVEALKDFSSFEQKRLVGKLKASLLEFKNPLTVPGPPYEGLEIQKQLPLTQTLTEDAFTAALKEIGAEMALSAQIVIEAVDDHVAAKRKSS